MKNARRTPRQTHFAVLAAALAMLLAACGQSGPLYLPDEAPRSNPERPGPAPPTDEDQEDDENDGARR